MTAIHRRRRLDANFYRASALAMHACAVRDGDEWERSRVDERSRVAGVNDLATIERFGRLLTRRQLEVLRLMRDREIADPGCDDAELVYERGQGFLDLDRVSGRTVFALIRACAIRREDMNGSFERYRINETGRGIVAQFFRVRGGA